MTTQADLALYDREGQLVVVAEVKNKKGTSPEWAAKLRRNILAHGAFLKADFFLLATPDRLYLWKRPGLESAFVPPSYVVDARPIFQPYVRRVGVNLDEISGQAFELVVTSWLEDLLRSRWQPETRDGNPLIESGLLDAIRDGRIEYEIAR